MRAWATKSQSRAAEPLDLDLDRQRPRDAEQRQVAGQVDGRIVALLDPRRFEADVGKALRVEEVRPAQRVVERRRADVDRIGADGESDAARRGPVEVDRQPPVEDVEFALGARKADRVDDETDVRARRVDAPGGAIRRGAGAAIGECAGAGDSRDEPGGRAARRGGAAREEPAVIPSSPSASGRASSAARPESCRSA